MLKTAGQIAKIAFLVVATGVLGWFLWSKMDHESRRPLDPFRRTLAEYAVEEVVHEKLPRRDEVKKLVVLPVVGDLDRRVSDMLYDELEEADLYPLVSDGTVLDYIKEDLEGRHPLSNAEAVKVAKALKEKDPAISGVLFSTLPAFTTNRKGVGTEVKLTCELLGLETGQALPGGVVSSSAHKIDSKASLDWYAPTMEQTTGVGRFFGWLLVTIGLPFALIPVERWIFAQKSTPLNLSLVLGLTFFSVFLALALMGFRPGWSGVLLLVLSFVAAGVYNHDLLEKIEESL